MSKCLSKINVTSHILQVVVGFIIHVFFYVCTVCAFFTKNMPCVGQKMSFGEVLERYQHAPRWT